MSYPKCICVDIDDTISFTLNRDWANAKPNLQLISKLNDLYDSGWEIWYVTARGSLSCKTRSEAEEKYRPIILDWFSKYNVKYTGLSFNKILASYYIDDKSFKPEEFSKLDIEVLGGGLSGAYLERRGNKVYKTANNTKDVIIWYDIAKNYFNIPKINSVIGETICMDYIQHNEKPKIFDLIDIIEKLKLIPAQKVEFETYIKRIQNHLNIITELSKDCKNKILSLLTDESVVFNKNFSFMHGDLTIDNVLNDKGKLFLIDPIYISDLYSSWLLDVGKLAHSLKRNNLLLDYEILYNYYKDYSKTIKIAELSQWIRIFKYSPLELQKMCINNIQSLINEL